jgi:hypothetical protein
MLGIKAYETLQGAARFAVLTHRLRDDRAIVHLYDAANGAAIQTLFLAPDQAPVDFGMVSDTTLDMNATAEMSVLVRGAAPGDLVLQLHDSATRSWLSTIDVP